MGYIFLQLFHSSPDTILVLLFWCRMLCKSNSFCSQWNW